MTRLDSILKKTKTHPTLLFRYTVSVIIVVTILFGCVTTRNAFVANLIRRLYIFSMFVSNYSNSQNCVISCKNALSTWVYNFFFCFLGTLIYIIHAQQKTLVGFNNNNWDIRDDVLYNDSFTWTILLRKLENINSFELIIHCRPR